MGRVRTSISKEADAGGGGLIASWGGSVLPVFPRKPMEGGRGGLIASWGGSVLPVFPRKPMERGSNCFLGRVRTSNSKEADAGEGGSNCFLGRVRPTSISKDAYGGGEGGF